VEGQVRAAEATSAQWRTQKIFMGGFIQWHMVVICIWYALFVTSYSCFPNQRFGEVCADQPQLTK